MPEYHRLRLTGGPAGHSLNLELDGLALRASKLEISADVGSAVEVRITIPAAVLDLDLNAIVQLTQPVMVKEPVQ